MKIELTMILLAIANILQLLVYRELRKDYMNLKNIGCETLLQ